MDKNYIITLAQKQVDKLAWKILWKKISDNAKEKRALEKERRTLEKERCMNDKVKEKLSSVLDEASKHLEVTEKLEAVSNEKLKKIFSSDINKKCNKLIEKYNEAIVTYERMTREALAEKDKFSRLSPSIKNEIIRRNFWPLWVSDPNWPWLKDVSFTIQTIITAK